MGIPDGDDGEPLHARVRDLVRAAAGDARALGPLLSAIEPVGLSIAHRVLGDHASAEDALIDAIGRLWPRLPELATSDHPLPYLLRAVRNTAIEHRRARGRRDAQRALRDTAALDGDRPGATVAEARSAQTGPELRAERRARDLALLDAVLALSEPGRTLVRSVLIDGLSLPQAAVACGVPESSARRHLELARTALAVKLRPWRD
jgi:RNA polymerase sigma factor (sigma-70 family)